MVIKIATKDKAHENSRLDFRTGSLLATTCKDKKLRIIDPRSGEVLRVGDGHQGNKAAKVHNLFFII